MRGWEEKRAGEIKEYILVTQIICLLIFLMIIFSFYNFKLGVNILNYPKGSIVLFTFCLLIAIYALRKLVFKFTLFNQSKTDELLLISLVFPLTLSLIHI